MMRRMTDEPRHRLGWLVAERRKALRLSKAAAARAGDVSVITWTKVEDGEPVRDLTYAAVDRALGWAAGSAEGVLTGGTPRLRDDGNPTGLTDSEAGSVRIAAAMLLLIREEYGEAIYLAALEEARLQDEHRSQRNRHSAH